MQIYALIVLIIPVITSCLPFQTTEDQPQEVVPEENPRLEKAQILDDVWIALEPNTSSHDRSNWQVVEAQVAAGMEVAEHFQGDPAPGCWTGPKPPENEEINPAKDYWYVWMAPYPATPEPFYGTPSPTAPPLIPEPFLKEAYFLVDPTNGEVIARRLIRVVY